MTGEIFELDVFGAEGETVIVEAYFAEGDYGRVGFIVGLSEGFKGGEDMGRARRMFGEGLAAAGVDADCAVQISGCCLMSVWISSFLCPNWRPSLRTHTIFSSQLNSFLGFSQV